MASSTLAGILDSLHTHLQTQTQLLPPLIHQLGLPPAAVETELLALQETLLASVESRVDLKRREVEEWMQKCAQVEQSCLRYTTALGTGSKATGSSLGELNKNPVLPQRFLLLTEHQSKLEQLYQTKLEHLSNLSHRIQALSSSLDPDFFPPELLQPPLTSQDLEDVTPERFTQLEKHLVRGKAEVSKRLDQVIHVFAQLDWMHAELGLPLPTAEESDPFTMGSPTPASTSTSARMLVSDPDAEYIRIFSRFVAHLEEMENEQEAEGAQFGLQDVDPTPGLLEWAQSQLTNLEDLKRRREGYIQTMYDQLEGLWRRLGVSESDMEGFVEAHRGSTEETVREYEEELERMIELRRHRMGAFIESAREEIRKLWVDLMMSEEDMADYAPFADDEHTEELLAIHEDEIRKLKEEKRTKAPLLASVKKYFEICDQEKELAAAASDQTRLLGRGQRDPGRLLREEKMRKRVAKEKPRLEQDLLAALPVWEAEADRPFLVHGQSILAMLMESVTSAERKPRAGSVPARSTTPVNKANPPPIVPGTVAHPPRGTVRQASQTNGGPPAKRQRTQGPNHHRRVVSDNPTRPPPPSTTTKGKSAARPPRATAPASTTRPVTRQQVLLGHGRTPSTLSKSVPPPPPTTTTKKISRVKRESFKPRPSIDRCEPKSRTPLVLTTPLAEEEE